MVGGGERGLGMMPWLLVGVNETGTVEREHDLEEVVQVWF